MGVVLKENVMHNCLSECRFILYNKTLAEKDLNKTNKQTNK